MEKKSSQNFQEVPASKVSRKEQIHLQIQDGECANSCPWPFCASGSISLAQELNFP